MTDMADALKTELQRIGGDVQGFIAKEKERREKVEANQAEFRAQILDIEQKLSRPNHGGSGTYSGAGLSFELRAALEQNAEIRAVADGKLRRTVMDLPGGFFAPQAATLTGANEGLSLPGTYPGIVAKPQRRLHVRDLLTSIPVSVGSLQYSRQTVRTNAAAPVTEGNLKPESAYEFELKTANIITIAHWTKASLQVLADTPALQLFLESELRHGVKLVEDAQLLKGSGIGNNLEGLYTLATAYSAPITVPTPTKIDTLRLMILQLELADFEATGVILHPSDWAAMELTKSSVGDYIQGNPSATPPIQSNPPRVWGVPVVTTTSMTVDTALVGDFQQAAVVLDREQARVEFSREDDRNFVHNLVTALGEERVGLATLRPGALVKNTDLPAT